MSNMRYSCIMMPEYAKAAMANAHASSNVSDVQALYKNSDDIKSANIVIP